MKQFLAFFLLLAIGVDASFAQGRNTTGTPPGVDKNPGNNHSNGKGTYNPPGHDFGNGFIFSSTSGFKEDDTKAASASETVGSAASATTAPAIKGTGVSKGNLIPFVLGSSFMTPTAWGSSGTFVFVAGGGTPNQEYAATQRQRADVVGQVGFGAGDASKFVSVIGAVNINDVSAIDNLSYSFTVSRKLGKFSSISAGAFHLFADPNKTDAPASYFVAYSQAIKNTKISYTVGAGTGRFYDNSPLDKYYGKSDHGTGVFANVSYNLLKNLAVSTEWTGTNLAFSSTLLLKPYLPVISVGVSEVTRLTGDHPTVFASIGKAFSLSKGRK